MVVRELCSVGSFIGASSVISLDGTLAAPSGSDMAVEVQEFIPMLISFFPHRDRHCDEPVADYKRVVIRKSVVLDVL